MTSTRLGRDLVRAQRPDTNQAQFERGGNPWFDPKREAATTRIAPNVRHAAPKREFRDPPKLRAPIDPEAQRRREVVRAALAKGKPARKIIATSDPLRLPRKSEADIHTPPSEDLTKRIAAAEARADVWKHVIEQRRQQQRARILAEYGIIED